MGPQSLQNNALETFASLLVGVAQDLAAHAWIPEILQMVCNTLRSLCRIRFRFKERGDVVSHLNQMLNIHWRERLGFGFASRQELKRFQRFVGCQLGV